MAGAFVLAAMSPDAESGLVLLQARLTTFVASLVEFSLMLCPRGPKLRFSGVLP